jgi:hypothetical protein
MESSHLSMLRRYHRLPDYMILGTRAIDLGQRMKCPVPLALVVNGKQSSWCGVTFHLSLL